MKKKIFILFLFAATGIYLVQGQNANLEKLTNYKIAFFTKKLNLTAQEAEKFWPVYNEFQDKRQLILLERAQINKNFNVYGETMDEKELMNAGNKIIDLELKNAALAQEYHKKFLEILPPVKVLKLYQAENQYRNQLLNELQDRQQPPPAGRPRLQRQ